MEPTRKRTKFRFEMKQVEFQFHSGGLYSGWSDDITFCGKPMIFVDEVSRQMLLEEIASLPSSVTQKDRWYFSVADARVGIDRLIPLSDLPLTVIRCYSVWEWRDLSQFETMHDYKAHVIDGHHFDVVPNVPCDDVYGHRKIDPVSGRALVFYGQYDRWELAELKLDELCTSPRASRRKGEVDPDVRSGRVVARRYVHHQYDVRDLSGLFTALPEELHDHDDSRVQAWCQSVLEAAERQYPDIVWYRGIAGLLERIRNERPPENTRDFVDQILASN